MRSRPCVHRLRGVIKHYPWGSRHVLAELLGRPAPSAQPEAELWLGAHPNGPSLVQGGERWAPFDELIREDPEYWLGPEVLARYGPRLPFLMKVLAVEQPLSLQVHPDAERAARVFAEDQHRPPSERRYGDPYAKPELVCALTRFEALCGVRDEAEIRAWLAASGLADWMPAGLGGADAVRDFFARWLRLSARERAPLLAQLLSAARRRAAEDPISRRVLALAEFWPDDPGLIAPVLLYEITLEPGEALFLPAGVLHCYLRGAAIEVMAASDNVVRAGLTNKPIHIEELLAVARFEGGRPGVVERQRSGDREVEYTLPRADFSFFEVDVRGDGVLAYPQRTRGPAILLCTEGHLAIQVKGGSLRLDRGHACVISNECRFPSISGSGRIRISCAV